MRKQDDFQAAVQPQGKEMSKKSYHKPVLSEYNDLRTVTLGNSPGGTESGSTLPLKRAGSKSSPADSPTGVDAAADIYGGN